jgi:hypothetical protein
MDWISLEQSVPIGLLLTLLTAADLTFIIANMDKANAIL